MSSLRCFGNNQYGIQTLKTEIRSLLARDKQSLMDLLRDTPEFSPADLAVAEEVCDCYLKESFKSGYHIFVLDRDSSIPGYICYGPTPITEGTWDIYWIAVAKELQGKGIGATLLTVAENKIKQLEGRMMLAETSSIPEYDKTRRFYQSHGYEVVAQIADFYVPGDDKIIFQKRLK